MCWSREWHDRVLRPPREETEIYISESRLQPFRSLLPFRTVMVSEHARTWEQQTQTNSVPTPVPEIQGPSCTANIRISNLTSIHTEQFGSIGNASDFHSRLRLSLLLRSFLFPRLQATSSVASVRERTIPIERPQLVGEVSANFCGCRVLRGQRDVSPRPYSRFSTPEPRLFLSCSSSNVLTRLSGPRSRPTASLRTW
jgi:hypothetical protein